MKTLDVLEKQCFEVLSQFMDNEASHPVVQWTDMIIFNPQMTILNTPYRILFLYQFSRTWYFWPTQWPFWTYSQIRLGNTQNSWCDSLTHLERVLYLSHILLHLIPSYVQIADVAPGYSDGSFVVGLYCIRLSTSRNIHFRKHNCTFGVNKLKFNNIQPNK